MMKKAIVNMCAALLQILSAYWAAPDRETQALMRALSNYIQKHVE
jgi:hypothetical protein